MNTRALSFWGVVLAGSLSLFGCENKPPSQPAPVTSTAPVAPAASAAPVAPEIPLLPASEEMASEPVASEPVAIEEAPAGPPPAKAYPPPPAASQETITAPASQLAARLSAGVALAQSLPTGSAMLFSVDYQITAGRLEPSAEYFWIIERTSGAPQSIAVRLSNEGTLQAVSPDWPPGEGPYHSYLMEIPPGGERRQISNRHTMQTTGEY
jgi:hypothetical protein